MERRLGVLLNPSSGKGRVAQHAAELVAALASAGDRVQVLQGHSPEHADEVVAEAMAAGLDALVAVGGDGTVHLALQHVVGTGVALGIVPLGTGNDAARGVGIGSDTVAGAVPAILEGHTVTFDVGQVSTDTGLSRYFLCAVSTGFDALVNARANRMRRPAGDSRYALATFAELRTFRPVPYRAVVDGEVRRDEAMFVVVGNGPSYGGGMRICDGADLHDGRLSLVWIHRLSRVQLLRLFPTVYTGAHLHHPAVMRQEVREVRLEAPGQLAFADGEPVGDLPVTVRAVPGGVRVLVPR